MAVDDNGQMDQAVPESYENLLDDYSHFAPPAADEVLQGTVLSVTAKDVIVDFGYKSEGIVPIEQFLGPDGEVAVQAGDVVDVMIDHGGQPEGYVLLSHTKAARLRIWDNLEKAYRGTADRLRPRAGTRQGRAWRWMSASRPSCPARKPIRAPCTTWIR